jgi:hypothetical protein
VSSRTRGPRKRTRKSRGAGSRRAELDVAGGDASRAGGATRGADGAPNARGGKRAGDAHSRNRAPATLGERPRAPWHPLPLSELLILVGAIATAIGFARNFAGTTLLLAGIAAVALGTIEVTLREHRAGFRSHTLLLSVLPVVVVHSAIVLVVSAFTAAPAALSAGLLLLDVAVFGVLFKLLRASYRDARERARAHR